MTVWLCWSTADDVREYEEYKLEAIFDSEEKAQNWLREMYETNYEDSIQCELDVPNSCMTFTNAYNNSFTYYYEARDVE